MQGTLCAAFAFGVVVALLQAHYEGGGAHKGYAMFGHDVSDAEFLAVAYVMLILSLVAAAPLGHLVYLHAWLLAHGLSTYDYIVQKREAAGKRQAQVAPAEERAPPPPRDLPGVAGETHL